MSSHIRVVLVISNRVYRFLAHRATTQSASMVFTHRQYQQQYTAYNSGGGLSKPAGN